MTQTGKRQGKRRKMNESGASMESMSVDDFLNGGFETASLPDISQGSPKKEATHENGRQPKSKRGKKQIAEMTKLHKRPNAQAFGQGETPKQNGIVGLQEKFASKPKAKRAAKEDLDAEEDTAKLKGKQKRKRASEATDHQDQLAALKDKDPEFYKYLLETDKELLNFQTEGSDEDDEALEIAQDEENEHDEGSAEQDTLEQGALQSTGKKTGRSDVLSQQLVDRWCLDAKEKNSMAALGRLIKAYRLACHLGDQEETLDATMRITSSTVFNKILLFVIKEAGGLFKKRLGLAGSPVSTQGVKKAVQWRKVEPLVKSFLGNSLHLLSEMTDEAMVVFLLKHLRESIPFLVCSDRLQRKYLKQVLQLFGEAKTRARVQAVLFLRAMATSLPPPFVSLAMKGAYRTFVLNAKFMSPANLPHINFMANCVVEIYGLDSAASYEHAFSSLRQLAILVKGAQTQKSKEAFREVYCWQTITSLELWAKLLATHSDKEELRPLIYPVAQLLMAAVRLVPTARYFPLRLRCMKALSKLGQACDIFIPLAPLLLETLQWSGLSKPAKAGGRAPSDAIPQLRAGKQMLETVAYQQALVEEVFLLLAEHLAQWSSSVSFPEYANAIILQVQQVAKTSKIEKLRSAAKGLVAAIRVNAESVIRDRQKLDCSPTQAASAPTVGTGLGGSTKTPMAVYAGVLAEKAARQRALQSSAEIDLGNQDDAEASESDSEIPRQDLLPELRKKSVAKKARAGDGANTREPELKQGNSQSDDKEDLEDTLKDFQLSGSDEDLPDEA